MGITRLGNITGLDRIGIPVAIAVRPNSRSVSVSQGKGLDLTQAMASALMEAIEGFHAEEIGGCRRASYRELAADCAVVDPPSLCTTDRPFDVDRRRSRGCRVSICCGRSRAGCRPRSSIPTTPAPLDGYFLAGSNGLASGNHLIEAISAAICELVERDAVAVWSALGIRREGASAPSISPRSTTRIAARCWPNTTTAGIAVRLWNVTTDIGIAAFLCDIRDSSAGEPDRLRHFHGAGCHPDRGDRAVPGSDRGGADAPDLHRRHARRSVARGIRGAARTPILSTRCSTRCAARDRPRFASDDAPTFAADDLGEDLRWELERLRCSGIERVDRRRSDPRRISQSRSSES